jgi:hypothetical protein
LHLSALFKKFNRILNILFPEIRDNRPPLTQYKITLSISIVINLILLMIGLIAIFGYQYLPESPESPLKIISRSEWNATNPKNKLSDFQLPIDRIIIAHTSTRECYNRTECIKLVKNIQRNQMTPPTNFDDITFNFLIGGDGNVYEGLFKILTKH